jgi:hypothetical protein
MHLVENNEEYCLIVVVRSNGMKGARGFARLYDIANVQTIGISPLRDVEIPYKGMSIW